MTDIKAIRDRIKELTDNKEQSYQLELLRELEFGKTDEKAEFKIGDRVFVWTFDGIDEGVIVPLYTDHYGQFKISTETEDRYVYLTGMKKYQIRLTNSSYITSDSIDMKLITSVDDIKRIRNALKGFKPEIREIVFHSLIDEIRELEFGKNDDHVYKKGDDVLVWSFDGIIDGTVIDEIDRGTGYSRYYVIEQKNGGGNIHHTASYMKLADKKIARSV